MLCPSLGNREPKRASFHSSIRLLQGREPRSGATNLEGVSSRVPLGLPFLISGPFLPCSLFPAQGTDYSTGQASPFQGPVPMAHRGIGDQELTARYLESGRGNEPTACGWPARHARPMVPSRCHRSLRAEAREPRPWRHSRCGVPAAWGGGGGRVFVGRESLVCLDSSGATKHSCWDSYDPKPARSPSWDSAALEPEVGGKARARPGSKEGDAERLPRQGSRLG